MERSVVGSWVWHSQDEFEQAMAMIVQGHIQVLPLVTNQVRIENAVRDGIEALHLTRDEHMKILIDLT